MVADSIEPYNFTITGHRSRCKENRIGQNFDTSVFDDVIGAQNEQLMNQIGTLAAKTYPSLATFLSKTSDGQIAEGFALAPYAVEINPEGYNLYKNESLLLHRVARMPG